MTQIHTTVQFNGQISDLSIQQKRQSYHIATKRTHQPGSNEGLPHKEHKNSVLIERTREPHKQPGHQQKKMTTQKTRFFPLQIASKIQDYTSYKTQRTRYYNKQSSKKEPGHN